MTEPQPTTTMPDVRGSAARLAVRLEWTTIGYNIAEGIVAPA